MTSKAPISERRRRRGSGNTLIEMVFTMMPTFALIFAFIDFGLLMFRWTTLQNAVREGCRYAVTFQTLDAATGQDASIKSVVQQFAMGVVKSTDSPQHIFVKYYSPTNLNTEITPGGNLPGNVVEVSVQNVSWSWLAPISGSFGAGVPYFRSTSPISVAVYSSDILGGYPVGKTSVAR